ncbi:MAG: hypothetical protein AB8F95_21915 [Bacteroidia bacterium]
MKSSVIIFASIVILFCLSFSSPKTNFDLIYGAWEFSHWTNPDSNSAAVYKRAPGIRKVRNGLHIGKGGKLTLKYRISSWCIHDAKKIKPSHRDQGKWEKKHDSQIKVSFKKGIGITYWKIIAVGDSTLILDKSILNPEGSSAALDFTPKEAEKARKKDADAKKKARKAYFRKKRKAIKANRG